MSEKKTVEWYMDRKGFIHFKEDDEDTAYFVTDKVKEFIGDDHITKGEVVEVEFENIEDEVFVSKVIRSKSNKNQAEPSKESKKQEPKQEPTSECEEVREVTVAAVAFKNNGISFIEDANDLGDGRYDCKIWYTVDIDNLIKDTGIKKGVKVKIKAVKEEKQKNKRITSITQIEEKEQTQQLQQGSLIPQDDFTTRKQKSIEAQQAVQFANNSVTELLKTAFDPKSAESINTFKKAVTDLSKHYYKLIQEIKNS